MQIAPRDRACGAVVDMFLQFEKRPEENGPDRERKKHLIPHGERPQLKSQNAWAVHYYPTYAVVDPKGVVRVIGLQPEHVEKVVQKLFDSKPS